MIENNESHYSSTQSHGEKGSIFFNEKQLYLEVLDESTKKY